MTCPSCPAGGVLPEVLHALRCTHGWPAFEESLAQFFSTQPGSTLAFLASQPAHAFLQLCTGCDVLEGGWSGNFVVSTYEPCALAHALSRTCRSLRAAFAFLRRVSTSWLQLASPLSKCVVHDRTAEAVHTHDLLCATPSGRWQFGRHILYPDVRAATASFYYDLLKEHATHNRETQSRLDLATDFNPFLPEGRVSVGRFDDLKQLIVASLRDDGRLGEEAQVLDASQLRRACAEAGSVEVADALMQLFLAFPAEVGAQHEVYINLLVNRGENGDGFKLLAAGPGSANVRSSGVGGARTRLREHLLSKNRNWASKLAELSSDSELLSTLEHAVSARDSGAPQLTQLREVEDALACLKKAMGNQHPQFVDAHMRLMLATQPSTQVICLALPGDMVATGSKKSEFVLSNLTARLNLLASVEAKLEDDVFAQLFSYQSTTNLRLQIAAAQMQADKCAPSARAMLRLLAERGVASVCEEVAAVMGISEIDSEFESTFRYFLLQTSFYKQEPDLFSRKTSHVSLLINSSISAAVFEVLLRSHKAQDLCATVEQVRFLTSGTLRQMAQRGSEGGRAVSRPRGIHVCTPEQDPPPPAALPPAISPPPSPPAAPSPPHQEVPAEPLPQNEEPSAPIAGESARQTKRQKTRTKKPDTAAQLAEETRAADAETHRQHTLAAQRKSKGESEPRYLSQRGPNGEQPPAVAPGAYAEGTEKRGADGNSMWIVEGTVMERPRSGRGGRPRTGGRITMEWVLWAPKVRRRGGL